MHPRLPLSATILVVFAVLASGCGGDPADAKAGTGSAKADINPKHAIYEARMNRFMERRHESALSYQKVVSNMKQRGRYFAGEAEATKAYDKAAEGLQGCVASLSKIGPPPAPKYNRAHALMNRACRGYEQGLEQMQVVRTAKQPAAAMLIFVAHLQDANASFTRSSVALSRAA